MLKRNPHEDTYLPSEQRDLSYTIDEQIYLDHEYDFLLGYATVGNCTGIEVTGVARLTLDEHGNPTSSTPCFDSLKIIGCYDLGDRRSFSCFEYEPIYKPNDLTAPEKALNQIEEMAPGFKAKLIYNILKDGE